MNAEGTPWYSPLAAVAAALLTALLLMAALFSGSTKLAVVILGGFGCVALALLSGNPRLFCLWAVMLTIPLNLSRYFTENLDRGGGETAIRIEVSDPFILTLAGLIAWEILSGRRAFLRIPKLTWIWIALLLMGCFAVLFGEWRRVAAYEIVRMLKVLLLFLVICNELLRPGQIAHAALALVASCAIQSVLGVAQYIKGGGLGLEKLGETNPRTIEILAEMSVQTERIWRVSALLLHPNLFGIFLAALLPLSVGLFLYSTSALRRLVFLAISALGVSALIATFSRSSWLSFAAAAILTGTLCMAHSGIRRRAWVPAALAALCMLAAAAPFSEKVLTRVLHSKEHATIGREEFKKDARRLIDDNLLWGTGLNSYVDAVLPYSKFSRRGYGYWIPPVHHIYYLWLAETGLIGLALHLLLLAAVVWKGISNLRIRDPLLFTINSACLAAMLAFMVDGFFSFSLRVNGILRIFWVLAGMILAIHYWHARQHALETAPADDQPTAEPAPLAPGPAPGRLGLT